VINDTIFSGLRPEIIRLGVEKDEATAMRPSDTVAGQFASSGTSLRKASRRCAIALKQLNIVITES